MRLPPRLLGAAILTITSLVSARAFAGDELNVDGLKYSDDVTVVGIKDGQLQTLVKGNDKKFDLAKVEWIHLDNQPNFNKAEDSRKDAKAAVSLYRAAINNINDRKLRLLAQLRAVGPNDADGKYTDAVTFFLDAYQSSPTDAVWKLRPVKVPAETSSMLKESATKIESRVAQFSATEPKKNLKTWELELLTKANDPGRASLARELGGDTGPVAPAPVKVAKSAAPESTVRAASGAGLEGVAAAVGAKQYDAAIAQADKEIDTASGQTAIQLFNLKAQAYEGKGGDENLALAAATYLRIPAHYPSSADAPVALLHAGELQKRLKHEDEAKRLFKEIVDSYPNTASAVKAKGQM